MTKPGRRMPTGGTGVEGQRSDSPLPRPAVARRQDSQARSTVPATHSETVIEGSPSLYPAGVAGTHATYGYGSSSYGYDGYDGYDGYTYDGGDSASATVYSVSMPITDGGGGSWSDYAGLASTGLSALGFGGLGSAVNFAGAAARVPAVSAAAPAVFESVVSGVTTATTGFYTNAASLCSSAGEAVYNIGVAAYGQVSSAYDSYQTSVAAVRAARVSVKAEREALQRFVTIKPSTMENFRQAGPGASVAPTLFRERRETAAGDSSHAEYFKTLRSGSKITTFEIPKWLDNFI